METCSSGSTRQLAPFACLMLVQDICVSVPLGLGRQHAQCGEFITQGPPSVAAGCIYAPLSKWDETRAGKKGLIERDWLCLFAKFIIHKHETFTFRRGLFWDAPSL